MVAESEYTRELAKYASELTFKAVPDTAIQDCKKLTLDTLGIAIKGSRTRHGEIAAGIAHDLGGKQESTVIGYGYRTGCLNAAFANGVMAHAIDFDDDYQPGIIHVGCAVISAALAIGEAQRSSGKDLIRAIIAGYDVSCRVAASVSPTHHTPLGFHPTATANCFGVAAAVGILLKLKQNEMVNALGIAGDQAGGLRQYHYDGSMIKHFHGGKAAQNGIFAALLAQKGFTGPSQILEGDWGFCKVLTCNDYNLEELTRGLGEIFSISQTSMKPYPSCRATHPSIDAALSLQQEHNIDTRQIEKLNLRVYDVTFTSNNKPSPETGLQALLSQQYCVADALITGTVEVDDFSPEKIKDEKVRGLMGKIEVIEDASLTRSFRENMNRRPVAMEIIMKDGKSFTRSIEYPLGNPENPMSSSQVTDKFKSLASAVLDEEKSGKLLNSVMNLEQIEDVRELARLLY